jgi:hypothetical protein
LLKHYVGRFLQLVFISGFKTKQSFDNEQQGRYKITPDLLIKKSIQKKGCLGKRQPGNNFKKGIRESKGNFGKSNHFILNSF